MGYLGRMDHAQAPSGIHGLQLAFLAGFAAMLWLLNQARRSFWLFSLLVLPGTFCHELCHWTLGHLLGGRPTHFSILPKREGRGWVLGSVGLAHLRWYNAFFIGLAPLLLLPLAYGLLLWRLGGTPSLGWPEAGLMFLLANLVFGAIPSRQDLKIAARSPIGWLLLAVALAWGWRRLTRPAPQPPATASDSCPWGPGAKALDTLAT